MTVSDRELEVFNLLKEGHSANALCNIIPCISKNGVYNRIKSVYKKTGAKTMVQAAIILERRGLLK